MGPTGPGTEVVLSSDGPARTRAVAAAVADLLRAGDLVLLVGELGAGKTTFTQGLAAALGVAEQVTSPTFTLVRPYACHHPGLSTLLHADLYRLDRLREVEELALDELVERDAVAVVEWGDAGAPVLGAPAMIVRLEPGAGDDDRTVTVSWAADRRADAESLAARVDVLDGARRQA